MKLDNHVALITGGSSGIGRGIAIEYAREGADVVVGDVREEPLLEENDRPTAEVVRAVGREATYVEVDVASDEQVARFVETAVEEHDGIDIAVNNAAIFPPGTVEDVSEADWDRAFDVNVKGVRNVCRHALPHLRDSDNGCIVNIASQLARMGRTEAAPYSATKGAVASLTRQMATDYADQPIRVNAIMPGIVRTSMTAEKLADEEMGEYLAEKTLLPYFGQPKDIGRAAVFLASEDSRYITGHCLVVDGGYSIW